LEIFFEKRGDDDDDAAQQKLQIFSLFFSAGNTIGERATTGVVVYCYLL
jgi:hypothetical protein